MNRTERAALRDSVSKWLAPDTALMAISAKCPAGARLTSKARFSFDVTRAVVSDCTFIGHDNNHVTPFDDVLNLLAWQFAKTNILTAWVGVDDHKPLDLAFFIPEDCNLK
jgi:hypothetical protein